MTVLRQGAFKLVGFQRLMAVINLIPETRWMCSSMSTSMKNVFKENNAMKRFDFLGNQILYGSKCY